MKRFRGGRPLALGLGGAIGFLLLETAPASGHPVQVGVYTEIPYGISAEHPYPAVRGGPGRQGLVRRRAPAVLPKLQWSLRLSSHRLDEPLVTRDGTVVVATASGIVAVGPDGSVRWSAEVGPTTGTPSLTPSGAVVVGLRSGALAFVDLNGALQRRIRIPAAIVGSPLVLADGSIVVAAFDRNASRFDASGQLLWRRPLPSPPVHSPAAQGQQAILLPLEQELYVVTPNGQDARARNLGAPLSSVAVDSLGAQWVLTEVGTLLRFNPRGKLMARTEVGRVPPGVAVAVAADGSVRVPQRGHVLASVSPQGSVLWRLQGEGNARAAVTIDEDGVALVTTDAGELLAVSDQGRVRWRVRLAAIAETAPVLGHDGTIYVATVHGALQAWR